MNVLYPWSSNKGLASWDEVDKIKRQSRFHQKTMLIIFFNDTEEHKIAIIPEEQKQIGRWFIERVLRPLTKMCHPQGMGPHEMRTMTYFDNAPVHNSEGIEQNLANSGFRRMERSLESPESAPCDLFSQCNETGVRRAVF
jgi:hypothetical protein